MKALFFGSHKPVAARCLAHLRARAWEALEVTPEDSPAVIRNPLDCGIPTWGHDVLFSVLHPHILPKAVLGWAPYAINFHPAPLPQLRGVGGINIAILEGWDWFAATAHLMEETVDTGPVIAESRFDIDASQHTAVTLERRTHQALEELFVTVVRQLEWKSQLMRLDQHTFVVTSRTFTRADIERLRIIQPTDDEATIERKCRAFWYPPHPGAAYRNAPWTLVTPGMLRDLA